MVKKANIKTNFIFSISYQILTIILPLVTAPYISRVLGAQSVGIYSYSQAFANYFYLFAMLGVNNYGNRAIARVRDNHKELSKTFCEIYAFQFLMGLLVSIIYVGYCMLFVQENRLIYILQSLYVLSGMWDANWFCFGMEKFKLTTIRSTIIRILIVIAVLLFVKDMNDLWIYTLIMSANHICSALVIWPFILKHIDIIKPTWAGIKRHIKPNLVLFWPVIAVSLYNIMDKLMLGYFSTEEEVAFYSYAEKIVTIPTTLILALDNVIMPRMSNLYATKDTGKTKYYMDNVMMFAMFMAGAMAFGMAGISGVFAPWFYGNDFVRCGYFMFLLSPTIIFKGWAGALRTQFIIPTGRDKIYIISLTTGALSNLIINALLIPRMGGVGAIIGTLIAEFSVCFGQFFMCRKDINIRSYMIDGFSFCLVGAIMYAVVYVLSNVSTNALATLMIQICSGGILYILLAGFYMVYIRKNPTLINEGLKMIHVKFRFKQK